MNSINPQAEELNKTISGNNAALFSMLSECGRKAFFPAKGILAQSAQAKGKKINATIGIALEDDNTPVRLSSISSRVNLDPSEIFPYAPSFGKPGLRKKWKEMMYEKNPGLKGKSVSNPVVTAALTHGLSITGRMFLDEGDSVILPDLYYGNYNLIFKNSMNVNFKTFRFFDETGRLDLKSFKETISEIPVSEKKFIVLNFPNNPSGYTPLKREAEEIASVLKELAEKGHKMTVILDDAYFGLVFEDDVYMESLFTMLADLHENLLAVKLDGITKEDYAWGFRVGFITYGIKNSTEELYSTLEAKTAGLIRGNISNAPAISQALAMNSFSSDTYKAEKKEKFELLAGRYKIVKNILEKNEKYREHFVPVPFNSGYFLCLKPLKRDSEELRNNLLEKYSTGLIAVNGLLRIAFSSTPTHLLEELFENIYRACTDK